MNRACFVFLAAGSLLFAARSLPAQTVARRIAIVVGANQASPGRRPLRYAHEDARRVAQVLSDVAGFATNDVQLLLDPEPGEILRAVDNAIGQASSAGPESLLLFYYSGHADETSLYPKGQPLPVGDLRRRFDDGRVRLRLGIIDACRGGGWTGAKGLSPTTPFDVTFPVVLSNEGSILISSSSGAEDAHESEGLQGSFFTHHWNAGLRGPADRDGDGQVTLNEAFDYAKSLTVRDTALIAKEPQHPSFHLELRGRADLELATLDKQRTILLLRQDAGPLRLVHLDTGLVVTETEAGQRKVRMALRPGRYVVVRQNGGETRAREVQVAQNSVTDVGEDTLVPAPRYDVVRKSGGKPGVLQGIVPGGSAEAQIAAGVRHANAIDPGLRLVNEPEGVAVMVRGAYGLGRGFHVVLPLAFAYGEESGAWEWIAWGGVPTFGLTTSAGNPVVPEGRLGAGADLSRWLDDNSGLHASLHALGYLGFARSGTERRPDLDDWTLSLTASSSHTVLDVVTLSIGAGLAREMLVDGALAGGRFGQGATATFGSVLRRGVRPWPLVRVHLSPSFSLDGYVTIAYGLATHDVDETYLAGGTWTY